MTATMLPVIAWNKATWRAILGKSTDLLAV
jgi:hypothetical protein